VRGDPHPGVRAEPLGLADRLHRGAACLPIEAVDEQDPVEVVGLVLDRAGEEVRALDDDRLAVHVEPVGDDAAGPEAVDREPGQGQAALGTVLDLLGEPELGVDQVAHLTGDVPGEDAQAHTDLRCRQAGAGRVQHGVGQVVDERAQLLVEVRHRRRSRAQDRIAEQPDRPDGHVRPLCSQTFVTR
jgi:hypothetical protein